MERGTPGYGLVDKTEDLFKGIFRKLDPFAAEKAVMEENREGRDPDSTDVERHENRWGQEVADISTDVLSQIAVGSALKVTKPTSRVLRTYPPELSGTTTKGAITTVPQTRIDKFKAGTSPSTIGFQSAALQSLYGKFNLNPNSPKVSTNEKLKQALIANDVIRLAPAFKGGKPEFRMEADYFDVSAALIGGGAEDKVDASGNRIEYNRDAVTKFGGTKSERRDIVYKYIKDNLKRRKKDGTGTNINRQEFNQYAKEQIAAEKDLRNAIRLLNLRNYASMKGIELGIDYPTAESQLEFLANINKAKHKPRRSKNKAGNYTETPQQYQKKVKKWEKDTEPFQQYTDYKETFDYGHIISAKTGFRVEDLGMNRISNTEIEPAHNVESFDPYTQRIIEILQEGNRERGSRREHVLAVQRMRGTSSSVIEDFVKWKDMKDGNSVRLDKILDKFIPKEQQENFLKFMQERFYEKRRMSGSLKQFMENDLGIPYEEFKNFGNDLKLRIRQAYEQDIVEWGNVIGQQQYDLGEKWMRDSIDEFISLHSRSKPKRIKGRSKKELEDIEFDFIDTKTGVPLTIEDLLDMITPYD